MRRFGTLLVLLIIFTICGLSLIAAASFYLLMIAGSINRRHHRRNPAARHGEGQKQINAAEQVAPHRPQLPRHHQGFSNSCYLSASS